MTFAFIGMAHSVHSVYTMWDLAETRIGGDCLIPGRTIADRTGIALSLYKLQLGHPVGENILRDCSARLWPP